MTTHQSIQHPNFAPVTDIEIEELNYKPHIPLKSAFINRDSRKNTKCKDACDVIQCDVESFVKSLMGGISEQDHIFEGELHCCGSFYEGLKVGFPDEFDYNWKLFLKRQEDLILRHRCDEKYVRFRGKSKDFPTQRFFDVMIQPPASEHDRAGITRWGLWACENCQHVWHNDQTCLAQHVFCGYTGEGCALQPNKLQQTFLAAVKNAIFPSRQYDNSMITASIEDLSFIEHCADTNGPAVTLLLKYTNPDVVALHSNPLFSTKQLSRDKKSVIISLDISLAIVIDRAPGEDWPLQDFCDMCHGIQLTPQAKSHFPTVDYCQLVAKGAYWNVSFSNLETKILKSVLNTKKKVCLKALKVRR